MSATDGGRDLRRLAPSPELAERALGVARHPCAVVVEERSEVEARFANNTATTNGWRRDRRVTVVSFVDVGGGTGVGVASGSDVEGASSLSHLVAAAEADALSARAADDAAGLIDGGASLDFADAPVLIDSQALAGVTGGLRDAFSRARAERHVLAGFATERCTTTYLATSEGTRRRRVQPEATLQVVARSADGEGSAWAGGGSERLDEVALATLHARVAQRLAWASRRVELPAGRYEVVMPPDAVADLMVVLSEAASGRDAEDGRSVFSRPGGGTRVGDRLSALPFVLSSDPAAPGLECAPFLVAGASGSDVSVFDNGAELGPVRLVADGRLERLRYHRAGAERSGVAFTPPVGNLTLALPGASASLDELVRGTERALLLTCLWYIREVDVATLLLTGLTRDGVYLVEHGEVVGAVNNFRFNESPVDVLDRVLEAGATERGLSREWGEWTSRTAMPALRVADFNMSSVSPAS